MKKERDYILGTNKEELERLGLQHYVWRRHTLNCWHKAGVTRGSKVLDVGAGPGFATVDLANIVGEKGKVVAVERSHNYVQYLNSKLQTNNVDAYELDLMTDEIPDNEFDVSWCRWVNSFVSDPSILVKKVHEALKEGGIATFHEYINYGTWKFAPQNPIMEAFVAEVMQSWRDSGGEPDVALQLPQLLEQQGFTIMETNPLVFSIRPADFMWEWPVSFIDINLVRLVELGRVSEEWADKVRVEIKALSANPNSLMVTPIVLEIIAKK